MSHNQKKSRALAAVRGALRGWAFAPNEWLPGMLQLARSEAERVPAEYRADATALINEVEKRT